jgi:hypothetical protein
MVATVQPATGTQPDSMRINPLQIWMTPFPHKKKGCSKMSRTNQTEIIEKACRSLLRMFEFLVHMLMLLYDNNKKFFKIIDRSSWKNYN